MELLQLRYFLSVADSDSMTQAAEIMNVSQSTLSLSIKRLETELNTDLFIKKGRKLQLTEKGKLFRDGTRKLLLDLDNLFQSVTQTQQFTDRTITVAMDAVDVAVESILTYSDLHKSAVFKQVRLNQPTAHSLLLARQVDFCISLTDGSDDNIIAEHLFDEPMQLLINRSHPLASRPYVRLIELEHEVLVSLKQGSSLSNLFNRFFSGCPTGTQSIFEVGDQETLALSVQNNFGVTFIPESVRYSQSHIDSIDPLRVISIPVEDSICHRSVYVSYLRRRVLSSEANSYLEFLRQFATFVMQNHVFPTVEDFHNGIQR